MSHSERITYLVYCEEEPSDRIDLYIQRVVGHLWYARMSKARIITGDDYTSLLVARECDRYGIPVRTFGVNKRPRNGVNPYRRVIEGYEKRNQLMIMESDSCFLLGQKATPLATIARGLGKAAYVYG